MTYFAFLGKYVGLPILVMALLLRRDQRQGRAVPPALRGQPIDAIVAAHVGIAVAYTTPWDNYLVATRVWWYDPELVTGVVLGWVPLEEYTFFVVQTVLVGLWLSWLARHIDLPAEAPPDLPDLRHISAGAVGALWLAAVVMLLSGWKPGTYLALELAWLLPPVILQLFFGADILWHYRRLLLPAIAAPAIYLSAADSLAIGAGTWTIDPQQSTGLSVGTLPVEEALFFTLTTLLIGFGVTLMIAQASQQRAKPYLRAAGRLWAGLRGAGSTQVILKQGQEEADDAFLASASAHGA